MQKRLKQASSQLAKRVIQRRDKLAERHGLRIISGNRQSTQVRLDEAAERVLPAAPALASSDESLDVWGYTDTSFVLGSDGAVTLTGNRYALCGQPLPHLLPWVEETMAIRIPRDEVHASHYPPQVSEPVSNLGFLKACQALVKPEQISQDPHIRLRHGHGHTQEEMYAIKYGTLNRIPDVVVFPESTDDVAGLIAAAQKYDVCVIPFGGGTSVSEALRCPADEKRMIMSIDMKRMNRVLWIDQVNRLACIQAGAVGIDIEKTLKPYGFTIGHEPDSIEFSTLGGWIATHASGMKKNKYGNIEDIVLDMQVATTQGLIERDAVQARESIGLDARRMMLGSEGNFGIITQAVVKLFPLPPVQHYNSVIFPSFAAGVQFMYDLTQADIRVASVRLVDNRQFQFSLALKPASMGLKAIKSRLEKLYVTKLKGFDPQKMVACTLVFEGTAEEVALQEKTLFALATKHGGMQAGAENGKRGYQLTYGIAYIRDFVMRHNIIAESFETSVPWDRALELCDRVKARLEKEHALRNLPGKPFITCRVSQAYTAGVCIYFYLGFYHQGVEDPSHVFAELETAARDEILLSGGSLSHHHGIGKLRQPFLPRVLSEAAMTWTQHAKQAVDPKNVFGCGNQQ